MENKNDCYFGGHQCFVIFDSSQNITKAENIHMLLLFIFPLNFELTIYAIESE